MTDTPPKASEQQDPDELPEFFIKLPHGGPTGRGRLVELTEDGRAGRFIVFAGSPARLDEVPSFRVHMISSSRLRAKLMEDGAFKQSRRWPGWLELAEDIECGSPSQGAEILTGASANGLRAWKTAGNRTLGDFIGRHTAGIADAWLVRGSSIHGIDLVEKLWFPESVVSVT